MDRFKLCFGVRNEGLTGRVAEGNDEERIINPGSCVLGLSNLGLGLSNFG